MNYDYSQGFKEMVVRKMMSPATDNVAQLCRELGIARTTIYKWKKELTGKKEIKEKSPRKWKLDSKFEAFLEAANEGKKHIGKWLRKHGLKSAHIEKWGKELRYMVNNDKDKLKRLEKENRKLKKELKELKRLLNKKNK